MAEAANMPSKPHPSEFLEFATLGSSTNPGVTLSQTDRIVEEQVTPSVNLTQPNDDVFNGLATSVPGYRRMSIKALAARTSEQKMSITEGLRLYPKAMAWSILLSCTVRNHHI